MSTGSQRKIDYCDAMLRGQEAGVQDAGNQAARNPRAWHPLDFYDQFEDTTAALAFERCYYRAYDAAQERMLHEQDT